MAKENRSEVYEEDAYDDIDGFTPPNLPSVSTFHFDQQKSHQRNSNDHLDRNSLFKTVSAPRNSFSNDHIRIMKSDDMSAIFSSTPPNLLDDDKWVTQIDSVLRENIMDALDDLHVKDINSVYGTLKVRKPQSKMRIERIFNEIKSVRNDLKNDDQREESLTVAALESILIESRPTVHISTHCNHHYKATAKENEFQISFEETHILRALIDEDANFSAYYAVIALLFEMEMNHFVQYGFKRGEKHNRSLRTSLWYDGIQFALLTNRKIYAMFCSILDRFGMHYTDRGGCIEIHWGQYKYDADSNKHVFVAPPHAPIDAYQLNTLYCADVNVQDILKVIMDDYKRWLADDPTCTQALKEHRKFLWEILSILLHRMLTEKAAEPDDKDVTKWMELEEKDDGMSPLLLPALGEIKENESTSISDDKMEDMISDDLPVTEQEYTAPDEEDDLLITEQEYAAFFGSDEEEDMSTTAVKFGKIMDLIREIKVIPLKVDKKNASEMREMPQRLALFKDRLVKSIKKIAGIEIQLSQRSQSACNVYIMQFANQYALREAQKKVDKIRENPKYNHEYKIEFRHMSKADEETKKQVGFVKKMQEKVYRIDIVNKTDPISQMIAQHLKSRQECKIKLLILNGCHSFILGKIFSEYVENVICIHPFVKIRDSTATTFTKYFYQSLSENMNSSKALSQSVLASYGTAKKQVAKECPNDNACGSHSHAHPYLNKKNKGIKQSIERIRQKQHQFAQLHLSENWNELQKKMADPIQFKQYRREMQSIQAIDDDLGDIYDEKTLMLSNLSHDTMRDLVQYLEDHTANPHFVERIKYQKNEHYSEFNVAFLKFKSESDRRLAEKLLEQKQIAQTLEFSDSILFGGKYSGKYCVQKEHKWKDLGWMYRTVPPCCCSPHHAHTAEDKLILLQDGEIINRELIQNVETIKKGMKQLKEKRRKRMLKLQEEKMPDLECEMGPDSSKCSSYSGGGDVVLTPKPKKNNKKTRNRFDDDNEESKNEAMMTTKNAFQNEFGSPNIKQNKKTSPNKDQLEKPKEIKKVTSNNNFDSQISRTPSKKRNTFVSHKKNSFSVNNFGGNLPDVANIDKQKSNVFGAD
eukprot:955302_1